jgi:hypothetical protein
MLLIGRILLPILAHPMVIAVQCTVGPRLAGHQRPGRSPRPGAGRVHRGKAAVDGAKLVLVVTDAELDKPSPTTGGPVALLSVPALLSGHRSTNKGASCST